MPGDIDPAQWQPLVDDLLQIQSAELLLLNGAGYSPWVATAPLAASRVVTTAEAASERWIELQGQVTHSHGPQGEHAHAGYAFTTWMDMSIAKIQAEAAATAIAARWPQWSVEVARELDSLLADLDELDQGYKEFAVAASNRQLIYSHPVYQYFERAYGLAGLSLHWEPGEMPSEEQWQRLSEKSDSKALFIWEAEPAADIRARMNALGLQFVVVEPGANRAPEDWLESQRANVSRLKRAVKSSSGNVQ